MKLTRPSRLLAALVTLFSLLFMQFAVASYVCPRQPVGQHDQPAAVKLDGGEQSMPGCTGMDMEQPSLCHAYDQADSQSLDKPGTPLVPPFAPASLSVTLGALEMIYPPVQEYAQSALLLRATAPPLAIQHCCFRN